MSVSLNELTQFLTQSTPRDVPPGIDKAARKGGFCGLMGLGFIFLVVGALLMYLLFPWRLHQSWQMSLSEPAVTMGKVTHAPSSNTSVNNTKVYTTYFEFMTPDEQKIKGVSYSYGKRFSTGRRVNIEYLPSSSHVARIKGTYLNFVGWGGIFALLGPFIGIAIIWGNIRSRNNMKRLLREGRFAAGHISRVSSTNVRINNKQQYRIEVSFETQDGTEKQSHYKTTNDFEIDLADAKKKTGDVAGVLYDPTKPDRVLLVDTLLDIGELQSLFDEADAIERDNHQEQDDTPGGNIIRAMENAPGGLFGKLKAAYEEAKKQQDS